jgi:hypothetical protein
MKTGLVLAGKCLYQFIFLLVLILKKDMPLRFGVIDTATVFNQIGF